MMAQRLPASRPFNLARADRSGTEVDLTLKPHEAKALAGMLDVTSLSDFAAHITVKPESTDVYLLRGTVSARVEQQCVVTLEPVVSDISEPIDVRVRANAGAEAVARAAQREVEFHIDESDPPEPLEGEFVDLAQIAVEFLAVGIDPYPRKPGVSLADNPDAPVVDDEPPADDADENASPFRILASIPVKKNGDD